MSLDIVTPPHPADAGVRGTHKRQKRLAQLDAHAVLHATQQGRGCVGRLIHQTRKETR